MTGTRQWNTGIVARGRIYFAADNKVYAFRLPTGDADANATPLRLLLRLQRQLQLPPQLRHLLPLQARHRQLRLLHGNANTGPDHAHCAVATKSTGDGEWTCPGAARLRVKVDVYRNGALIVTTRNDGFYTDRTGGPPPGTFTYQVCNAGTQTCSNQATVTF